MKFVLLTTVVICYAISACAGFQIFSVSPTAGPTTGGTIVTLSGEDLSDATGCKFGTAVVAVISYVGAGSPAAASGIVCQAPSQGSAANVISVSAVIDGDVTTNSLPWIFYGQLQVLSLFPSSGPISGAVVTMTGSGFLLSDSLVCKVLGVTKPAILISSTQIICPLNSVSSAQSASVEVSNNNQQFTSDNKLFAFYATESISRIIPSLVRSSGGNVVSVIGSNFQDSSFSACKFELISSQAELSQYTPKITSTIVPALFVSATTILCTTPVLYGDTNSLKVASNGVHFLSSPMVLKSFVPATISSITPTVASSAGGDIITIQLAQTLVADSSGSVDLRGTCIFGGSQSAVTVATLQGLSAFVCAVPPEPSIFVDS